MLHLASPGIRIFPSCQGALGHENYEVGRYDFHRTITMRQALRLHPDSRCAAATQVEVEVALPRPGNLVLQYVVTGTVRDIRLPHVTAPNRSDELWQHTCFEAFVGSPPGSGYYELNFSPSTEWAAYRFSSYRTGMSVADEIGTPRLDIETSDTCLKLKASLALNHLPKLPSDTIWRLGLSAVIEETNGRKSYWALAHPPGDPDFHHHDSFTHELPVAVPS
jgi:hypothetical protein